MHTLAAHECLQLLVDRKLDHGLAGCEERCTKALVQSAHALITHDRAYGLDCASYVLILVDRLGLFYVISGYCLPLSLTLTCNRVLTSQRGLVMAAVALDASPYFMLDQF
jgi:hypothetical protein